jgi:hypothetical protein
VSSLFTCPKCFVTYEIVRRSEPPTITPKCEECGEELPWGDARDRFGFRLLQLARHAATPP